MTTSTNTSVLDLGIDEAFELVSDPSLSSEWLVGAQTVRQVDAEWPAIEARFAHRIGFGPFTVPGSTTVREIKAPHVLELAAGMGLLGESRVRFELLPTVEGTQVTIVEVPDVGDRPVMVPRASKVPAQDSDFLTTPQGVRLADTENSLKAGARGPTWRTTSIFVRR